MKKILLLIFLLIFGILSGLQEGTKDEINKIDDGKSVSPNKVEGKYLFDKKNSYKALLLSAVIPGGGQFYCKSYLKGFLVAGLFVHHLGKAYENNKELQKIKKSEHEGLYEHFYDKRQSYVGWIIGITLYSMLDAFVDARLYNYYIMKKEIRLEFLPEEQKVSLSVDF